MISRSFTAATQELGPTGQGSENPIGQSTLVGYHIDAGLTGTIDLEMSMDGGTTWDVVENGSHSVFPVTRRIKRVLTTQQYRLVCSSYTSGSANAYMENLPEEA